MLVVWLYVYQSMTMSIYDYHYVYDYDSHRLCDDVYDYESVLHYVLIYSVFYSRLLI